MLLTAQERLHLQDQIKDAEGWCPHAYQDPKGYWTIGYGRLVDERLSGGITPEEGTHLLVNDIRQIERDLAYVLWTRDLDAVRYCVIVELTYNMGLPNLMTFKRMIAAIERHDWDAAARELLDSKWAREDVSMHRSRRLSEALRIGGWSQ